LNIRIVGLNDFCNRKKHGIKNCSKALILRRVDPYLGLLKQVRKKQGVSQEAIFAQAGVDPRCIGEIKRGKTVAETDRFCASWRIWGWQ
jgi:DNA-binding XRE family transcriptional regulator